ncbi:MAG: hypothetical protein ACREBG_08875 [Pyrinomonadaceae bacterium]
MRTLLVTFALLISALCVGLWWYLRLRHGSTQRLESREDAGRLSGPSLAQLPKQESDPEISQNVASALATEPDDRSATEPSVELVDANAPAGSTLVILESTTLDSEEDTLPIDDAAQEPTDQPSLSDSPLPTESILKGTEISPQGDRSSGAQVGSQFSKANQDLDSVPHQDTSPLASDSDVPPSVQQSATATTDPIPQLTASDETGERIGEPAVTRTERDESAGKAESSQEEKANRAVSVLDARSTSETVALEPSQEEPANDVESLIGLSDLAEQDITTIANEQTRRVPVYRPLAPIAATVPMRARRSTSGSSSPTNNADLGLRLQLLFGRGGDVKLNLVADRREHMPDEVEVSLTQGNLLLMRHQPNYYQPVSLSEASSALHDGVEWRGRSDSCQFRWILSRRELHVLAEGDVSGLYPFGSTARLQLNARHVVLAASSLRDDVLAALSEVGCTTLEMYDETTPGVPAGWLLFRNVIPTHAVPMRDGADILNALCPLPDIEPHFVGGIHLERNTWLFGHPPQIRLTGDLSGVEIKLDGQPVIIDSNGSVSASDWDAEGDHQLWFGSQTQIYTLRTMEENWQRWPAIDFRLGATICGASIDSTYGGWGSYQVNVPATNPLLIGATPGDIYYCRRRNDLRLKNYVTCVPFQPVWALPLDPAHADRGRARLFLLRAVEPALPADRKNVDQSRRPEIQRWVSVLNSASKKRLRIEPDTEDSATLWLHYRVAAKQLRRSLR